MAGFILPMVEMSQTSDEMKTVGIEAVRKQGGHEPDPLSLTAIFEVLVNQRRRRVLYALHERSNQMTLTELAEQVAALERDAMTDEISEDERQRLAAALHQSHLPRLADIGIVEYDREEGTLSLLDLPERLQRYLDFAAEDENQTTSLRAANNTSLTEF